jgi:hypothetical protein
MKKVAKNAPIQKNTSTAKYAAGTSVGQPILQRRRRRELLKI